VESLDDIADAVATLGERIDEMIFETVRNQMSADPATDAKLLERRLARVRRSLDKAEALMRAEE
jgi:hypothetical protein